MSHCHRAIIATGLGGGSFQGMLLDRDIFWIRDQVIFFASLGSAITDFIAATLMAISAELFLVADAATKRIPPT